MVPYLIKILFLQFLLHFSSYREDMGICLQLMANQEYLNVHLQCLMKPTCLLLFVNYPILSKMTQP